MSPEDTLLLLMYNEHISSYHRSIANAYRAVRLVATTIRLYGSRQCKPVPLPEEPKLHPAHVSVIIPTIDISVQLITTFRTMLANRPREIIVVTTAALVEDLVSLVEDYLPQEERGGVPLRILHISRPNKRRQMAHAIEQAEGEVIVLADDDVFWPPALLKYFLAVLDQKPNVGGVGALEEAYGLEKRAPGSITMWEAFEARRLDMFNNWVSASTYLDGSVSILSGRTVAYRAKILKDKKFLYAFTHEYWMFGRVLLHPGDDQFITRWIFNHGWDTHIQTAPEALFSTTATSDRRHVYQVLRWSRSAKRCHIKRLFTSPRLWKFPYLTYTTINSVLGPLLFLWKLSLAWRVYASDPIPSGFGPNAPSKGSIVFWTWLTFPLIGHISYGLKHRWWLKHLWAQRVKDLTYAVVLNFYIPATLHYTGWGSRDA